MVELHHLVVGGGRVLPQEIEDRARGGGAVVGLPRKVELVLLGHLARGGDELVARVLHHRPRPVVELGGGEGQAQVVAQGPVVLLLAHGEAVLDRQRDECRLEEAAEVPEGPGGQGPLRAQIGHRGLGEDLAPGPLRGQVREHGLEVLGVLLARGQPVPLHHAEVGHVARGHARLEVRARPIEVGGDGRHPRRDRGPFRRGPVAAPLLVRHALQVPVHAAEGLVHVGVERPLPVLAVLVLVQHEVDLVEGHVPVDPARRREPRGVQPLQAVADRAIHAGLLGHGRGRPVAQHPVHAAQLGIQARAAEVGGHHGVPPQELAHVLGLEPLVGRVGVRPGRRRHLAGLGREERRGQDDGEDRERRGSHHASSFRL